MVLPCRSFFLRIDFFILRPHGEIKLTNVEPVMNALQQGSRLSNLAALGEKLSPADKEMADDIVKWPVVAQVEHPITIKISTNNRYTASMAIYESHKVWYNFSVFGIDSSDLPFYSHCIYMAEWSHCIRKSAQWLPEWSQTHITSQTLVCYVATHKHAPELLRLCDDVFAFFWGLPRFSCDRFARQHIWQSFPYFWYQWMQSAPPQCAIDVKVT